MDGQAKQLAVTAWKYATDCRTTPDPRLLGPCVFAVPSLDGEAMKTTRRMGILVAVQKLRLHTSPCVRDGAEEIAILPPSVADASRIRSR